MVPEISLIKGLHPGFILDRELKKRKIKKKHFAGTIREFPQTLGAITKGKRRLNPLLSIQIGKAFGIEENYFMILQALYDIEQEKKKQSEGIHPDFSKIRPALFWDTDLKKIDWLKYKNSVIKRVFERGNEQEIMEIIRFYGRECVSSVMHQAKDLLLAAGKNTEKYL